MILKDKIIIVTGGSGLIGKGIIENIFSKGGIGINADIGVVTDFDKFQIFLDITNIESIRSCIDSVFQVFGRIDGWVNNAYPRTSDWGAKFEDVNYDSWAKNIDYQLNSCFSCSQLILQNFVLQGFGSIVNIGSIYGIVGNDFSLYEDFNGTSPAAYSAIKGGIINFTRYLAAYYGSKGIRVNCVSPGGVFDNQHKSFIAKYESRVPLRRLANPDDIAPAVSFLLSDDAKYITGHNLVVDGGWTII